MLGRYFTACSATFCLETKELVHIYVCINRTQVLQLWIFLPQNQNDGIAKQVYLHKQLHYCSKAKNITEYLKGNDTFLSILEKLVCPLRSLTLDIAQRITKSKRRQTLQAKPFPDTSGTSCFGEQIWSSKSKARETIPRPRTEFNAFCPRVSDPVQHYSSP